MQATGTELNEKQTAMESKRSKSHESNNNR